MNLMGRKLKKQILATALLFGSFAVASPVFVYATDTTATEQTEDTAEAEENKTGGGYAVSGQVANVGYSTTLYNADNGLPTSDANCIYATSAGYIWIGGYSGILRYDGQTFERLDSKGGLTSGKVIFEDSKNRIWVGTNDNGIVMLEDENSLEGTHFTYQDGIPSSTIRAFAESSDGVVYIGTTSGICYVDDTNTIQILDDSRINSAYIIHLKADTNGVIYGNTRNGEFFSIDEGKIKEFYTSEQIGVGSVTTFYADQKNPGMVYIGTDVDKVYYGKFGVTTSQMTEITVGTSDISWITEACDRIWINSNTDAGYLDENNVYHSLDNIPLNSAIEMMVEDYQGNLWYASSRQGVMKVVTNNFQNISRVAGLNEEVVNATAMHGGNLYIGTDKGIQIVNEQSESVTNELSDYIGETRVRCLLEDLSGNLWVCTYTDSKGLVCYTADGQIVSYTEETGFISNEVRCATLCDDGRILVGTNGGLAILNNGQVEKTYGEETLDNTVLLTVEEGEDGVIYAGTDGDGIYEINGDEVKKVGRDDGLTSDVILRVKKDTERDVVWIITSNSIEFLENGKLTEVENFPYNNNFDIYYDTNGNLWVLSSYGIYCVKADDLLANGEFEYRLYNTSNGMSSVPTGNAFSYLDEEGNLFVAGRAGVDRVNINHYFNQDSNVKVYLKYIYCDGEYIYPDEDGNYVLPSAIGRIYFYASVLDYSMTNPTVKLFFEGAEDDGITVKQSELTALEYTGFRHGNYVLHIQTLDGTTGAATQDATFSIEKQPEFFELFVVRILLLALLAVIVGLIVWRVMTGTIVRRQYEQIREAKEEADRANSAKSRFLANMSHEIRTPINTIMGMDEMILREDATDVPKGYFMSVINYALDIRGATESLLNLVNDILDLSKIESGKMHLVEQEYDVEDLLRNLASMIRVRATQKELNFVVDVDETVPKRLYGDVAKIKQIVLNLLTNAVKYTEVGGFTLKLSVSAKTKDMCSLRFSVEDTGIGVKEEDLEKLFTAYERLDEEKNSGIQGTGLGLDISRQFASLMNGNLWCESVYGEGSEFIFTLDQKIVDETPLGEFKEHDDIMAKGPYVPQFVAPDAEVLVVDDNPMNLNVIRGLLKATKMFVTTAASGEECLEKLRYGSFNVVLLDHMMPGMDGVETCRRIRETWPDLPVYALTANATAGEAYYISKGFNGYLSKPIDSLALEKTIMRHLPEEIMAKPNAEEFIEELTELPKSMYWLYDYRDINVEEGIKNSGGVSSYIFSLQLFYETIDGNVSIIQKAYDEKDWMLYKIKVHALKSSARIIGAMQLSNMCENLEDAGNKKDIDFIYEHSDKMIETYLTFKDMLAPIDEKPSAEEDDREEIDPAELEDAYSALKELVPMMDYDSVEMIFGQLREFKLPEEDDKKISEMEFLLKKLDWDKMEEMLGDS